MYHELLSVFDYLSDMETEISALAHQIDNKSGNLDELVERQTMLIEQFERAGGLTYKSRTRSALLGLGFSENDFTMPVGNLSGGHVQSFALQSRCCRRVICSSLTSRQTTLTLTQSHGLKAFERFQGRNDYHQP